MRRVRGVTLTEVLVVVAVTAMVLTVVIAISLQGMRMYAATSTHIQPQEAQMIALQRLEREMREAMVIDLNSTANAVEIIRPAKDANGLNLFTDGLLVSGKRICFFLGNKVSQGGSWLAVPSATGDTLFRIESTATNFPLGAAYSSTQARVIIEGILSTPMIDDPDHEGQMIPTDLFTYAPIDDNDTPDNPDDDLLLTNTSLVRITLTVPVAHHGPAGIVTEHHTLSTQFCIRNLTAAQAG